MYEQLMIVGNLGKDAEMRYTSAGVAVTTFPVAVNRNWTNQDGAARASMEVTADQVRFLGGKDAANGNGVSHGDPDLAHVEEDDEVPF